jgi:hypothetical protein
MDMNIDVAMTIKVIVTLIVVALLVLLLFAFRSIRTGLSLQFFRKRRDMVSHGWHLIFLALVLVIFALALSHFGEPVVYRYFPPSPTVTNTATITMTPTITNTPSMTFTPTITPTLQYTYTPSLPQEAQATIQTPVGPDTAAAFSSLLFTDKLSDEGIVSADTGPFAASVQHIYGGFSFDGMIMGVQWTAVWMLNGKPVHIESKVWKATSGGYGYTDWDCSTGECVPGEYSVQIFVGSTWKSSGTFTITGGASATTGTPSPSASEAFKSSTPTPSPSATLVQ